MVVKIRIFQKAYAICRYRIAELELLEVDIYEIIEVMEYKSAHTTSRCSAVSGERWMLLIEVMLRDDRRTNATIAPISRYIAVIY